MIGTWSLVQPPWRAAMGPTNTVLPVISPGTGSIGVNLSVTDGTWLGGTVYLYQWYADGVAIPLAVAPTLNTTLLPLNTVVSSKVTALNLVSLSTTVDSSNSVTLTL